MPVIAITSLDDPRVAPYHAVADPGELRRSGRFIVEGRLVVERLVRLVSQAPAEASHYIIESMLLSEATWTAMAPSLSQFDTLPIYVCPGAEFKRLAGLNLHRGCLAMARRPNVRALEPLLAHARTLLVLEGVGNPDNIGGIFRNAAAFGVDAVLLAPGCGDPLYRKAIRTSMGATLSVPYADLSAWPSGLVSLRAAGFLVLALTPGAHARAIGELAAVLMGSPSDSRARRVALLLGAEGPGLSPEALDHADHCVRIPTTGDVDSLNVAVACGIALSHLVPLPVS